MLLKRLLKSDPLKPAAYMIYKAAGEQARLPVFYADMGVADDFDGRFDLLVIHVHLLIRRLRALPTNAKKAQQFLFDVFMQDLDRGLRLAGVGDTGIGHRIKNMTRAYYGRATAYDEALDRNDRALLCAALGRNLYRGRELPAPVLDGMADYLDAAAMRIAAQDDQSLLAGEICFGQPPEAGTTAQPPEAGQ